MNIGVNIVEPGGTSTNFSAVSSEKVSSKSIPEGYETFVTATGKMFESLYNIKLATAEEVASVIYQAATDRTDTLRYVVGNDDFKKRVDARLTLPDQEYIHSVKNGYLKFMPEN